MLYRKYNSCATFLSGLSLAYSMQGYKCQNHQNQFPFTADRTNLTIDLISSFEDRKLIPLYF